MASAKPQRSKDARAAVAAAPPPAPQSFEADAGLLHGALLWRCILTFVLRRQLEAWVLVPWLLRGGLKARLAGQVVFSVVVGALTGSKADLRTAAAISSRYPVYGNVLAAGGRLNIEVTAGAFDVLRFARFLGVGGLAAATNFGSRFAWSLILPFEAAVLAAYATGMVLAFTLFRFLVFPGSPLPFSVQVRNFVAVNIVGASLTFLTAFTLMRGLFPLVGFDWHAEPIAHAMAIVVPVATSWIGHRRFTFARG